MSVKDALNSRLQLGELRIRGGGLHVIRGNVWFDAVHYPRAVRAVAGVDRFHSGQPNTIEATDLGGILA